LVVNPFTLDYNQFMNWEMLGHEWAVKLLKEHIVRKNLRHAYLFTGPYGVGRRTLALRFAQALNCPRPISPGVPCRMCRTCKLIDQMQYPDLSVVQADQVGGMLKVDQVRELQHSLALAPFEGRYRVALLLRFEEANPNAANALLKTLEEPTSQVVLVLTAESAERLLPTIVSRCEVLRLRPLPLTLVQQGLQNIWGLPDDQARLLAQISGGRPGYALQLHNSPDLLVQRQTWLDDQTRLLSASRVDRFAYAENLAKDKETLRSALRVWLSYWRDVLLRAGGASGSIANLDREKEIEGVVTHLSLGQSQEMVASLERTLDLLESNVNARLATEVLLLDLPHI
jgi:DNA polymerase-3 subunit delta'